MITFPGQRGLNILEALANRNISVAAVIVDKGRLNYRDKLTRARHILRHSGPAEVTRRLVKRLRRQPKRSSSKSDVYRRWVPVVHRVATAPKSRS